MDRTHMTIAEVARALDTHERNITRWRGGIEPRYAVVRRMGDVFGRDPEWFYAEHERAA